MIMKYKKISIFAILIAFILVIGTATSSAVSKTDLKKEDNQEKKEVKSNISNTGFSKDYSDEEMAELLALQLEGYEDMSVMEFQDKVWEITDTAEYRALLERFYKDEAFCQKKDSNDNAAFLFYTLKPLASEKWQTGEFGGYTKTDYSGVSDNAVLEYSIFLTIKDAAAITVREYDAARRGMMDGLKKLLKDKKKEQLQDEIFMNEAVREETESLKKQWGTDQLQITVEWLYMPLSEPLDNNKNSSPQSSEQQQQEKLKQPNGTKEDYQSLLALKIPGYKNMSVTDFNLALLEWANEDYERLERIGADMNDKSCQVQLDKEELSFVYLTAYLSEIENAKKVQSHYSDRTEEDPCVDQNLPDKVSGDSVFCSLYYQFSYHINDKNATSIGERDRCVGGMTDSIQSFWDGTDTEELAKFSKDDILNELKRIAAENSSEQIEIKILEDQMNFEYFNNI